MRYCEKLAVIILIGGASLSASAAEFQFTFPLDAAQEVQTPAVVSPGSGLGEVLYDTDTNVIDWNISFQDLLTPVRAAHFHGPADVGMNATIILGVPTTEVTNGVLSGSGMFPEMHERALLDGQVYFNIHTVNFPSGEIRGQVVPEPGACVMLLIGAATLAARRRRAGRGVR